MVHHDIQCCPNIITWDSTIQGEELKEVKSSEYMTIKTDQKQIRLVRLLDWQRKGRFVRIDLEAQSSYKCIYVFDHQVVSQTSQFQYFAAMLNIEEKCNFIPECTKHYNHDWLLPFFHGNTFLHHF